MLKVRTQPTIKIERAKKQTKFSFCELCGSQITSNVGRGRPRLFCDSCGKAWKFLNAFEKEISNIRFHQKEKKVIVGKLFRIANNIHNKEAING